MTATARLEYWKYDRENHRFCGFVYDDLKGRFADREFIYTSMVAVGKVYAEKLVEGEIAKTIHSNYLLGKPWDKIKECLEFTDSAGVYNV